MNETIQNRIIELFPKEKNAILNLFDMDKIDKFYNFLLTYKDIGGFFSKSNEDLIIDRHLIESIYHIYKIHGVLNVSRETEIADVGTGPGLPGFLFACLKETPKLVALIDSQKKKLQLLEEYIPNHYTDLKVKFYYQRVEEIKGSYDIVVSRSSVPYPWTTEIVFNLVKKNGFFVPFLAKKNYDLALESKIIKESGMSISSEIELKELNFLGERHIKFLKKINKPKHSVPRKWKIIKGEIDEKKG